MIDVNGAGCRLTPRYMIYVSGHRVLITLSTESNQSGLALAAWVFVW